MKKAIITFICFSNIILAQSGALNIFNTSHFARAIRLGNAYTGVADGPETLFYNSAGLSNLNTYSFLISNGQGFAIFAEELKSLDYALIIPLPNKYGTVGVSINSLSCVVFTKKIENKIYDINYARKLGNNISIGITASYYHINMANTTTNSPPNDPQSNSGSAFDINISTLYRLPKIFNISAYDNFQIGFQMKNILNTKMKYANISQDDFKFQNIRAGFSYTYNPNLENIYGLSPIKFMLAFDAVFIGADYNFTEWQPNYGLELTLFEYLQLSFGRENEVRINNTYSYTPQFPVNRYGFGIKIPFQKLLNLSYKLELKIDYSISDWQKIDEKNGRAEFLAINQSIDKQAVSVGLNIGL